MPDSKTLLEWREFIANSRAIIKAAVIFACHKYHHLALPEVVEELTEQLILLLLVNDCHRLKTYDPNKASFKTWLSTVADHLVSNDFKQQRKWDSLDETFAEKLMEQPKQELNLISQEQQIALEREIEKLSEHDRCLINLIRDEVSVAEIAKRLNIQPDSVHRMKHRVIQKLRAELNKDGGANLVPEFPTRKMKIIQNNLSRFFCLKPI